MEFLLTQARDAIHTSLGSWECRGRHSSFDVIVFVECSLFTVMVDAFFDTGGE